MRSALRKNKDCPCCQSKTTSQSGTLPKISVISADHLAPTSAEVPSKTRPIWVLDPETGGCGICLRYGLVAGQTIFLSLDEVIEGAKEIVVVVIAYSGTREVHLSPTAEGLNAFLDNPGRFVAWVLPEGMSARGGAISFGFTYEDKPFSSTISLATDV